MPDMVQGPDERGSPRECLASTDCGDDRKKRPISILIGVGRPAIRPAVTLGFRFARGLLALAGARPSGLRRQRLPARCAAYTQP